MTLKTRALNDKETIKTNQNIFLSNKKRLRLVLITFILCAFSSLQAQKSINVKYVESNDFKIDGVLDEAFWETTTPSSGFNEWFPTDSKLAEPQTELRMLYNDKYLYIAIKGYSIGNKYSTPSYQRDFSISGADVVNLMFDTYSDRVNAFLFGINPFGVVREGIISLGGVTGKLDLSWDTKWLGESTIHDGYFISEIRIPMASFKFNEGVTKWKFSAMRSDTQSNTKSNWSRVPQNQNQLNQGYFGDLIFEKPLKKSKSSISFIPYATPSYSEDYIKDETEFKFKAGFDVKIPVKSSLMLDLTVNPDFSSDDVVAGQNNVTRFEIKQDETRQFFIDNGDLFNGFGLPDDALAFYSRRVGVGSDTNGSDVFVPITAGAKFTGKLSSKLRIGVLDVQTAGMEDDLIPKNNNLVLAAEQQILGKSNIGFFFINRQVTNTNDVYNGTDYNRVAGTDLKFYSKDNTFDAHVFLHKSFTPDIKSNAISTGTDINLDKRNYTLGFTGQYIDEGFQSDLGYTKRKDIIRSNPFAEWKFYPKAKSINTIKVNLSNDSYWMPSIEMKNTDFDILLGSEINFTSGAKIGLIAAKRFQYLSKPFDPTGNPDGTPLPIGEYNTSDLALEFNTDKRKALWLEGSSTYGSFYLGDKFTTDVKFQYRFQPIFYVSLKLQFDDIEQPEPYSSAKLWYIGPTFNFTFTKSIFWNTDIQYSSQSNSFFYVSRLQWRYAPLSDMFLIFNDSYNSGPITAVERGVYLKINYWFDITGKKSK